MKMTKRWLKAHRILHCISGASFLAAWYAMVNIAGFIKPQCSALPWIVKTMYSFSVEITFLALIPIVTLALLFKRDIAESKPSYYWSSSALVFSFSVSAFLIYIAYLPVFDCGWSVPMEVQENGQGSG